MVAGCQRAQRYSSRAILHAPVRAPGFLHVIDTLWREHIDHLDVMRSGIGLRGVAQRDPLVEFKREAFRAFEQLKRDLERYIVDLAMRGVPQILIPAPPEQALPRNLQTNALAMAAETGQTKAAGALVAQRNGNGARPTGTIPGGNGAGPTSGNGARNGGKGAKGGNGARPAGRTPQPAHANMSSVAPSAANKIGRNEPCYCGSGKKYKMCHGR